ncbi:MAG: RNA polymerase sigma factor [Eubacteriales bacterium]
MEKGQDPKMNGREINDIIKDNAKIIYSWCAARTSNRYDAEDLSQEIIFALCGALTKLTDEKAIYGFMWNVARNIYCKWYKKKQRVGEHEVYCEDISENKPSDDTFDIAESLICSDEDFQLYLLRRELSLLAEKYRSAVVLYYIDEKSISEISSVLSLSESMVKYLLFKGRQNLKEGMQMDRKLGTLSYNPKKLIPMYSGEGPNYFWDFMSSTVRQNIAAACFNDKLNAEEISLETGMPLAYIEDDIGALTEKQILTKDGNKYKTNIVIITKECREEAEKKCRRWQEEIADKIIGFIERYFYEYKSTGFYGSDFSENTLRWQLSQIVWRSIFGITRNTDPCANTAARTAWGERADLWLEEEYDALVKDCFRYCGIDSGRGDTMLFCDYIPAMKGDHHDFWGKSRYVNIMCDVARSSISGRYDKVMSEYDLADAAELCRMGYINSAEGKLSAAMPVYTAGQYEKISGDVSEFAAKELADDIYSIDKAIVKIIAAHNPSNVKSTATRIAMCDSFKYSVCAPARVMAANGFLNTAYTSGEMPGVFVILAE